MHNHGENNYVREFRFKYELLDLYYKVKEKEEKRSFENTIKSQAKWSIE